VIRFTSNTVNAYSRDVPRSRNSNPHRNYRFRPGGGGGGGRSLSPGERSIDIRWRESGVQGAGGNASPGSPADGRIRYRIARDSPRLAELTPAPPASPRVVNRGESLADCTSSVRFRARGRSSKVSEALRAIFLRFYDNCGHK